jgi:hypothetical protein
MALNAWSALFTFLGAFFYAIVYTVWLKRRTWLNIVFGGLAGSWAVLAGATAADPQVGAVPLALASSSSCGRRRISGAWPSPSATTTPPPACPCCRWWSATSAPPTRSSPAPWRWSPHPSAAGLRPRRDLLAGAAVGGFLFIQKAWRLDAATQPPDRDDLLPCLADAVDAGAHWRPSSTLRF